MQPIKKPSFSAKQVQVIFLLFLLLLILFGLSIFFLRKDTPASPDTNSQGITLTAPQTPNSSPSQISAIPLTSGKGIYAVSHAKSSGPQINKVVFDPLNIDSSLKLTVYVYLKSDSPIKSVTGSLTSDSKQTPLAFSFHSEEEGYQIFKVEKDLNDTVLQKYIITITGVSSNGQTKIIVAPRS